MSYQVLLFYKYCDIVDTQLLLSLQSDVATSLGLVGRILIADEGINGTLCGSYDACKQYEDHMKSNPLFVDMNFKKSTSDFICFKKLQVKVKNEIVITRGSKKTFCYAKSLPRITPDALHEELSTRKDLVLFDMRNKYESRIGRFVGAICPQIQTTRELEVYLDQHQDLFVDKDVVMYCTGGVRCERTSVMVNLLTKVKRLRHLENGIHAYVEKYPDGFFRGRNYVFDDRISIKINDDVLTFCDLCMQSCDLYNNCLNAICNKHYICCDACLFQYNGSCSKECIELTHKKIVPLRPPLPSRMKREIPV
jgi:UPF0176 protein